jgi:hypothetical protein
MTPDSRQDPFQNQRAMFGAEAGAHWKGKAYDVIPEGLVIENLFCPLAAGCTPHFWLEHQPPNLALMSQGPDKNGAQVSQH